MKTESAPAARTRIPGLDTLRLVCALCVMFSHIEAFQIPQTLGRESLWGTVLRGIYMNLCNGPAAVIVFFVISGFCIHFPYRHGQSLPLLPFWIQRFLRIGLPVFGALGLGAIFNVARFEMDTKNLALPTILWSLVAEAIYYAIYPALRLLAGGIGWKRLLLLSYVPAGALLIYHRDLSAPQSFGHSATWLAFLPCWLLGCLLAEQWTGRPSPGVIGRPQIWAWRGGMLGLAMLSFFLLFHTPAAVPFKVFPWTLLAYAVASYFWLQREMDWAILAPPARILEWAGQWSYSIYLVHESAAELWRRWIQHTGESPGALFRFTSQITLILLASYIFFLLIERPAQRLARRLARRQRLLPRPSEV